MTQGSLITCRIIAVSLSIGFGGHLKDVDKLQFSGSSLIFFAILVYKAFTPLQEAHPINLFFGTFSNYARVGT